MQARLERLPACGHVWVLRLYSGEADDHQPYEWCCTVVHRKRLAYLLGADKGLPPSGRDATVQALKGAGVTTACWERWRNGVRRWVEFKI